MPADPVHHTPMTDSAWDGPAQEKKIKTPVSQTAARLWAWHDPDGDETTKAGHKFPHHMIDAGGGVGAGHVKACTTIIGVLNGGMGGSGIPDKDRQAVYDHAAAHLKDAKVEDIPELKAARAASLEERAEFRSAMRNMREVRYANRHYGQDFELRSIPNGTGGSDLLFTGFACVTCRDHDDDSGAYEMEDWLGPWVESVVAGSFRKTLSENCDTAFLVNHEGMTLARTKPGTLKLSEQSQGSPIGLHSEARLDPKNPFVKALRSAVERGDIDEMSFAFRVTRQEWNEDYDRRWITEVSLQQGDVSAVNYGANPHTGGTVSVRKGGATDAVFRTLDWAYRALSDTRAGKTFSADNLDKLQSILAGVNAADSNIDQALIDLSKLIGVPNPDTDAPGSDDDTSSDDSSSDDSGQLAAGPALTKLTALPNHALDARARLAKIRRPD